MRGLNNAMHGGARAARGLQLGTIALTAAAIDGTRRFLETINTFQSMENRLKLVTTSSYELRDAMQTVADISDVTRIDIGATGTLYGRLGLASKDLGLDQLRLARLTETVNKTIAISGSTFAEQTGGIIQFSQAIASSRLSGEELRSVLENIPALGEAIAKGLGVGRGELRRLGEAGELTAEAVIGALERIQGDVDEQFALLEPTIQQSWTRITNNIARLFGENSSLGRALQEFLSDFADATRFFAEFFGITQVTARRINELGDEIFDADERVKELSETIGSLDSEGALTGGDRGRLENLRLELEEAKEEAQDLRDELNGLTAELTASANRPRPTGEGSQAGTAIPQTGGNAQTPEQILAEGARRLTQFRARLASEGTIGQRLREEREAYEAERNARLDTFGRQGGAVPPDDFGGQGSELGEIEFERSERRIEVLRRQREATEELGESTRRTTEVLARLFEVDTEGASQMQIIAEGLRDNIRGLSNQLAEGTLNLGEFTRALLRSVAQRIASATAEFGIVSGIAAIIGAIGGPDAAGAFFNYYYGRGGQGTRATRSGDGVGPADPRGSFFDIFHDGGIVGRNGRRIPLGQGTVPILAQEGETILPRGARAGGGDTRIEIIDQRQSNEEVAFRQQETRDEITGERIRQVVIESLQGGGDVANAVQGTFGIAPQVAGA